LNRRGGHDGLRETRDSCSCRAKRYTYASERATSRGHAHDGASRSRRRSKQEQPFGSKRQVRIALKELQAAGSRGFCLCRGAGRRCRVRSAISVLPGRESGLSTTRLPLYDQPGVNGRAGRHVCDVLRLLQRLEQLVLCHQDGRLEFAERSARADGDCDAGAGDVVRRLDQGEPIVVAEGVPEALQLAACVSRSWLTISVRFSGLWTSLALWMTCSEASQERGAH
jgi:hypothetical protein